VTSSIGPGTVLADRYRLEDLLAESEGARFWRATDTVLARSVAIHAVSSEDPRSAALLEAARVSATVTDPHLLRVLDCDDSGGITWVVNEWGDGVSLDLMLQQGTLPPSRAAWLAREVADAIAVGHAQGVAHGRLNPESVLVTHSGAVKLIGYVVDASLEPTRAPNPLYGELDDREADVIDLAGILYAALTGRWAGVSRSAVPRAPHEGRRPLRPRQVRAGVPRTLDAICERVLHKEGSRHALPIETAQEIAAALADYVGDPTQAAPLDTDAMHAEPTVSVPRGDLTAGPAAVEPEPDDDWLESTQLSAAVPDDREASPQAETPENEETLVTMRTPAVASTPPPPFEDLPERPLFAGTERRAPRDRPVSASTMSGLGATSSGPQGESLTGVEELAPEPGADSGTRDTGGFWPFVDESDNRNDVHTGTEGRGWFRTAVIIAVLLVVVLATAYAFNRGRKDGGDTSTGTDPSGSTQTAAGAKIAVARAQDFDPLGDNSENPGEVGNVIDGDPTTTWSTSTYYNNPALGGLKAGVGVLLDFGRDRAPRSVTIQFKGKPTDLELYAAPAGVTQAPDTLSQLDRVGSRSAAPTSTTIRLDSGTRTRYLLVWLTKLPPVKGGFRGEIADVTVRS
jgi:serine/threonine protein kinase